MSPSNEAPEALRTHHDTVGKAASKKPLILRAWIELCHIDINGAVIPVKAFPPYTTEVPSWEDGLEKAKGLDEDLRVAFSWVTRGKA